MKTKAIIVVMSHLSDIQENISDVNVDEKINFVKFILLHVNNLNQEIDANEMWEKFKELYN